MANKTVTTVTRQSWGSRLGGSVKGIGAGLVIFLIAFPILFWNEGRSVKRYKTLREGAGIVVTISPDQVDPSYNESLIHVSGQMVTDEYLSDPLFADILVNALKLRRNVQMYQWIESSRSETKKKVGGGTETVTTYSYAKGWSDRWIDSSRFQEPTGHQNPASLPFSREEFQASHVKLGAFDVPSTIVGGLSYRDRVPVPADAESDMPNSRVSGGAWYIGYDPANPEIGDVRVDYEAVYPGLYSIVAKQTSNSFAPYRTKAGGNILLVQAGFHDADSMFQAAEAANRLMTWLLRLAGFLMMLFGLKMVFGPLGVLADVLPFLGSIVRTGTGLVAGVLAFVLSLITISIAWLFYRPVLGVILLVVAGAAIYFLKTKWKGRRAAPAPAPAEG